MLRRHATGAEVFSASSLRNRANLGSSPFDQTSGSERARSSRVLIRSLSEDEERSSRDDSSRMAEARSGLPRLRVSPLSSPPKKCLEIVQKIKIRYMCHFDYLSCEGKLEEMREI